MRVVDEPTHEHATCHRAGASPRAAWECAHRIGPRPDRRNLVDLHSSSPVPHTKRKPRTSSIPSRWSARAARPAVVVLLLAGCGADDLRGGLEEREEVARRHPSIAALPAQPCLGRNRPGTPDRPAAGSAGGTLRRAVRARSQPAWHSPGNAPDDQDHTTSCLEGSAARLGGAGQRAGCDRLNSAAIGRFDGRVPALHCVSARRTIHSARARLAIRCRERRV